MLAVAVLWTAIVLVPPEQPGQPQHADHSIAGGTLQILPLGVAVPGLGASDDSRVFDRAVTAGYRWGFSVGVALEPIEHLLISASAGFNQSVWIFDNDAPDFELCFANDCYATSERGLGHLLRVGPELRVGWTSRWWMAWALVGGHLGLSRVRFYCDTSLKARCDDPRETDVGGGVGGGLGLAIRPLPRFAVGLESAVAHTWLDHRDDPFRAARAWELGLIAIVGF